eukprot:Pgem_evm1s1107
MITYTTLHNNRNICKELNKACRYNNWISKNTNANSTNSSANISYPDRSTFSDPTLPYQQQQQQQQLRKDVNGLDDDF